MTVLSDNVLDNGVNHVKNHANAVYICSQEPTTYTEATSTYALGNKSSISVTGPVDGDTSGRKVTIDAITGGNVTATGTATHYAVVDTANSELIAAEALVSSQAVTSGNTFTLDAFDITIPDPA